MSVPDSLDLAPLRPGSGPGRPGSGPGRPGSGTVPLSWPSDAPFPAGSNRWSQPALPLPQWHA